MRMKKMFAAVLLGMVLLGAGSAFAAVSPVAEPVQTPTKEISPKTADFPILYVEGAGIILTAAAAFAAVRSRKDA